jgi:hypothetical protein
MNKTQIIPGYTKLYREEFYASKKYPELVETHLNLTTEHRLKQNFIAFSQFYPLREWYNKPIYITSGYCSAGLNQKIRPEHSQSEHRWFDHSAAWDFVPHNPEDLLYCFHWMKKNLCDYVGQLILESDHVHVSIPTLKHWREVREL